MKQEDQIRQLIQLLHEVRKDIEGQQDRSKTEFSSMRQQIDLIEKKIEQSNKRGSRYEHPFTVAILSIFISILAAITAFYLYSKQSTALEELRNKTDEIRSQNDEKINEMMLSNDPQVKQIMDE